ncbi:APC family permease [Pyrobaculum sp.]|uniref:APC family permease n=1 Tax=Pyrobaculum sp. TaxID=2004705 RepID=UPI003D0BDF60
MWHGVGELSRQWLRRRLGVFDIYALVHADTQSTFYFLAGYVALAAGLWGFVGTVYGVVLMAAIALTYGEMGSRFPETGGSYLYVKYSFGAAVAYLSTWLLAFDQVVMVAYGTIDAAKAVLKLLHGATGAFEVLLALVFSGVLFLLALLGIRESASWGKAVAVMDLTLMFSLIVTALATSPSAPPFFNWGGVEAANLFLAFSLLSRGFTGLDALGQLAGEAREPLVQVPKATVLLITIGALGALGLMASIMSALTPHDLTDPAIAPVLLAEKIHPVLYYLVAANIIAVMLTAALTGYIAFSRLTYILADEGHLPPHFWRLHKRFRTPHISLTVAFTASLLLIYVGEIKIILAIYALGSLINYLLVALALAKASRSGTLHGAFSTPLIAGIPLSAWIAMALIPIGIALTLIEKYPYLWAWGLWIAAGLILYYYRKTAARSRP